MLTSFFAADDTAAAGNPILNIAVFVAFIVATMFIVTRVGKGGNKGASAVSYTHLTLPTTLHECRSRWAPYR